MHKSLLLAALPALAAASVVAQVPLSPIRMNQVGLLPWGPKRAMLPADAKEPLDWTLTDASGAVKMRGKTRVFGQAADASEHVHQIDFSGFEGEGTGYVLRVGDQESRPFAINAGALAPLKYDALAYFYHNRAGTPIEARFAGGEQWARPAGHPKEVAGCFAGKDTKGNDWPGCDYTLDVTGGWYDAGDHGKYVVNGGISLWTLLNLYERLQAKGSTPFADGRLAMQVPDGKRASVPVEQKRPVAGLTFADIDAGGLAHHKVADEKWTGLPMPPHLDPERRLLYPPTTAATLNLAANAAQCARVWKGIDDAFAARCLAAATRAFEAAKRNPEVYAAGDRPGSGNYGDGDLSDEFFWAAVELLATTGDGRYAVALPASKAMSEGGWADVAALGTMTLALKGKGTERDSARAQLVKMADAYVADEKRSGYGIPYAPAQTPWGSNSSLLNRAIIIAYAHDITGKGEYRSAAVDALDYVLGRNPLDQSYVSGYGARPLLNPHHRFWARQLDPKSPPPPPGALSGGPNSISFSDDVAKDMRGTCAPQTCWKDDIRAYTLNEITINWNAPLAWVATFVDER